MAGNKDFKPIISELRQQGWSVDQTTQGHWKATPPDASKSIVHFSASNDTHALKNTLKDLRHSGFIWPPPSKRDRSSSSVESVEPPEVPVSEPGPAMETKPTETAEEKMDRLWRELKEAKSYLALTEEHMVECRTALEAAQKAFAEAEAERVKAAETLKSKKAEFDQAFETAA
jgi:hypothetical protein